MSHINTYSKFITSLSDDEVFVFGANLQGFHGAGSAGFASFGESGNVWRKHDYGSKPDGWKGLWNVKGKIGAQVGRKGKSYALPTVTKCGAKCSLIPDFQPLYECCLRNPSLKFYFAQTATTGLNGYSASQMAKFITQHPIPSNFYIHSSMLPFVEEQQHIQEELLIQGSPVPSVQELYSEEVRNG